MAGVLGWPGCGGSLGASARAGREWRPIQWGRRGGTNARWQSFTVDLSASRPLTRSLSVTYPSSAVVVMASPLHPNCP